MTQITAAACAEALTEFRARTPLVQCLTNIVVAGWTANVMLAAGGAPAMVDNPREAGVFAPIASGVLVNMGTPYAETLAGMEAAAKAAHAASTPWVLDAVAVGALPDRTDHARQLLVHSPAIIRGNASEISGLKGGQGGRGVDSTSSPEAVVDLARQLATDQACVVAASGPVDHLTDGTRLVRISNGHELMTRVTGVGCSLGALMAGFAGVVDDGLLAAAAATGLLTVAADRAVTASRGPGTFAVALLDELALVSPEDLERDLRLS